MPSIPQVLIVHDQVGEPVDLGKVPCIVLDRRGYQGVTTETLAITLAEDLKRFEHATHATRLAAYRVMKAWLEAEAGRYDGVAKPTPRQRGHRNVITNITVNVVHSWTAKYATRPVKLPHARAVKCWKSA